MEIGRQVVYHKEDTSLEMEAIQVQQDGRIPMPASFDSMRELLSSIEDGLPHNQFLRNLVKE